MDSWGNRAPLLTTQSDERLTLLVRHGSEAAFEAIVQRHRHALLRHAARVLSSADAEEAVQDALVSAHAALERGAEVRALGPWLHAVVHNAALAILRRSSTRPECHHNGELHARSVVDAPHAIRAELRELVDAVQSLPPRQRDAIVMRELEGRSYSEIGARLGATNGAVRQLLNRARIAVRNSVGAVIPTGPLARWLLSAPDSTPALAAKLSGATVLTAASTLALLPVGHLTQPTRPTTAATKARTAAALIRPAAHAALPARVADPVRTAGSAQAAVRVRSTGESAADSQRVLTSGQTRGDAASKQTAVGAPSTVTSTVAASTPSAHLTSGGAPNTGNTAPSNHSNGPSVPSSGGSGPTQAGNQNFDMAPMQSATITPGAQGPRPQPVSSGAASASHM